MLVFWHQCTYVIHCGNFFDHFFPIGTCAVIECEYGTVIDFCFIYLFIHWVFMAPVLLLNAVIDCIIIVIITDFYGTCAVIECRY